MATCIAEALSIRFDIIPLVSFCVCPNAGLCGIDPVRPWHAA